MPVAAGVRGEVQALAARTEVLVAAQERSAASLQGVEDFPVARGQPVRARILRQCGAQHIGQEQSGRSG